MADEYAIAEGHDNEGNLDTIDDIRVSGKALKSSVVGLGEFDDGLEREYIGGNIEDTGTAEWDWLSSSMLPSEYGHIKDTYLGGLRSGPVTVRTRHTDGSYANYNATLTLPKRGQLTLDDGGLFVNVRWRFTSGVVLP